MAKMIPPEIDPDTKSKAEKKLYPLLRDMPDTETWTVIHSVGIAEHETQSEGEIDFIIVIPERGTYILEVKGGAVSYYDGKWHSRGEDEITKRIKDPRAEADDAMRSIVSFISNNPDNKNHLEKTLFGYGVIFPDTDVTEVINMPDIAIEQVSDRADTVDPAFMKQYILRLSDYWMSKKPDHIYIPQETQCEGIVNLLRPVFSSGATSGRIIQSLDRQILRLTESQKDIFEGLLENERCLIKGSAGTGKTVIAANFAVQSAAEGMKVGLFCYNRRLSDHLLSRIGDNSGIICGSFTDFANDIAERFYPEKASIRETDADIYYRQVVPGLLCDALLEEKIRPFDLLVLDEAQDLISNEYIEAIDCAVKGGLKDGRWCFFMDSERQNIFQSAVSEKEAVNILKNKGASFARYTLKENCRNSPAIIEALDAWFGTETRTGISGEYRGTVEIKEYSDQIREASDVVKLINRLESDKVSRNDITILSPVKKESSCVNLITQFTFADAAKKTGDSIGFCTIQGFKGLESPVIIITDIKDIETPIFQNLLYVGASRAKSFLFVFAEGAAYKTLSSFIIPNKSPC